MSMGSGDASPLRGLPPLVPEGARTLVLGSFPSASSLAAGRYYAHPRNHFWPLLALIAGCGAPESDEDRLALLASLGIALWDMVGSCEREGSLDASIRGYALNDIAAFLAGHGSIERVLCNGSFSYRLYRGLAERAEGLPEAIRLPSTSPVPSARYRRLEDRLPEWRAAILGSSASARSIRPS